MYKPCEDIRDIIYVSSRHRMEKQVAVTVMFQDNMLGVFVSKNTS